jgi:4-amino-4-deoxy-L-arabinose transferase-like glycosyltransferase
MHVICIHKLTALGALVALLTYLITKRIWGRRIGWLAGGMAALYPPLVLLSRDLVSESLFIALALVAILFVLNFRRSGGAVRWAAGAGAVCGLAALTRNTGIVLVIPIALGVWTARPLLRPRSLAAPATAVLCAALVVAPWAIRNSSVFDRFVPFGTAAGIAAAGTYNPASYRDGATHGAWRDPQIVPRFTHLFATPGLDEAAIDSRLRRAASDFAWQHPGYVAETFGWNLIRMFEIADGSVVDARGDPVDERGIGSADPTAERVGLGIAVLLAMIGAFALVRDGRRRDDRPPRLPRGPAFLWLTPIAMILVAAPLAGLPRYRLPADPFLLILAAIGATWAWSGLSERRGAKR